jgi:hypothetical protein
MNRKHFLKNSFLATGAVLLPNAIWAFDKNNAIADKDLNKFISKPNLKRFKISTIGTKFFETELSIAKSESNLSLARKYFISENIKGIATPALLETANKESFVFIPELYQDKKLNGFMVKVCENGICEETKIFTHENQGFYAFWGKPYLNQPTLYHYNLDTFHLMRMHRENEKWINHRVMPIYPDEMLALYQQQLQQVKQEELTQQFGYDFEIHKDGFYQFLSLKNDWEQSILTKEKEAFEKANQAQVLSSEQNIVPLQTKELEFSYTNPFVPIYCKGDDLSYATIKPSIIYEEVPGTNIEIPNMPAYKTQDDLGDCRAFSLAVLLQFRTCQKWKSEIPDCKNPPADMAISYFGLLAYTNKTFLGDYTFRPNNGGFGMNEIIDEISKNGARLILESCKPFENLVKSFSLNSSYGLIKRNEYFNYLKSIYESLNNKDERLIKDCSLEILKLNNYVDLKFNQKTLKKALTKGDFDHFLYTLFFSECEMESFPSGFSARAYPADNMNVTTTEIKEQIVTGLKLRKPVIFPSLCVSQDKSNECTMSHSIVISGFKQVKNGLTTKDLFKIHNSWGLEWQLKNNDGWVDADTICQNTVKTNSANGYRIDSGSVIWLD